MVNPTSATSPPASLPGAPVFVIEETLGTKATKLANEKALHWVEDTWNVITRTVMDTAQRGLFHCTLRFEDVIPQDPENQARLLKVMDRQNLKGSFKTIEDGVQLEIFWGHQE